MPEPNPNYLDAARLQQLCNRTIPSCVTEVVGMSPPDRLAIVSAEESITYHALEAYANRLANVVLEHCGSTSKFVVLLTERGDLTAIGMLAILKAGKVAVPLHPVNREARALDSVIHDFSPNLILTDRASRAIASQVAGQAKVFDVESPDLITVSATDPGMASRPDELAFILYTSGSTGKQKGVMHSHRNILSRLFLYKHKFQLDETDRSIMMASADHVSGIMGTFRPLVTGGRMVAFRLRSQGFDQLERTLNEQQITIMPMVNSVFRTFATGLKPELTFPSVRMIILGGEAMTLDDVEIYHRHFSDDCLLLNTFGSTELPTYRQFVQDKHTKLPNGCIPVGYPVTGVDVSIIGEDGQPVASGEVGEIITHSSYLALGYWNRPEETQARFFVDEKGTPACRTGDNGRLSGDGILEFVGRKDWQVKILGNRVELVEIERALSTHPNVHAAAVTVASGSNVQTQLCAYVVQDEQTQSSTEELKAFLRQLLPDYMVPLYFVTLKSLPLTGSGKVDRRALPDPQAAEVSTSGDRNDPPVTELEKQIAGVCESVLGLNYIGANDNLFDFGADSLKVIKLVNRINQIHGISMSLKVAFEFPTVAGLARYLSDGS
jgi:amino acid adenylation domain-containing protein